MYERLVQKAKEVKGFAPAAAGGAYVSRLLVDQDTVGSTRLTVNHFTLRPGQSTPPGSHPAPYDEVYYVLRGRGVVHLGHEGAVESFAIEPDSVVFIPAGTVHALDNTAAEDLELITVMPEQPVEGVNPIYDERRRTWKTARK
jgi:mannose-6-phosphate isomerase-like protein (cupin superfamily)